MPLVYVCRIQESTGKMQMHVICVLSLLRKRNCLRLLGYNRQGRPCVLRTHATAQERLSVKLNPQSLGAFNSPSTYAKMIVPPSEHVSFVVSRNRFHEDESDTCVCVHQGPLFFYTLLLRFFIFELTCQMQAPDKRSRSRRTHDTYPKFLGDWQSSRK